MRLIIPTGLIVSTVLISMVLTTPADLCMIRTITILSFMILGITEDMAAITAIIVLGEEVGTARITLLDTVGIAPTTLGGILITGTTATGDTAIITILIIMSTDIVAHHIIIMQAAEVQDLQAGFQQAVVPD